MHTCSYFQIVKAKKRRRHPPLSEAQLEAVARRFRILGVASRLRVLNALMDGPRAMTELAEATELSQSNLSRQVTELELAGCVVRTRRGREVEVAISDPTLEQLCELVCGSLQDQASAAHASLRPRSRR